MAERRMFARSVVDSDAFLEMPLSAQALYFHLNMRADDDGFVNNAKSITNYVSATPDDLSILIAKRFVIRFDSGVIVIKHWKVHNTLKSDRYHPTDYQDELALLCVKPNKAYTEKPQVPETPPAPLEPEWNQSGTNLEPQVRVVEGSIGLGKSSLDKPSKGVSAPTFSPEKDCRAHCTAGRAHCDTEIEIELETRDKTQEKETERLYRAGKPALYNLSGAFVWSEFRGRAYFGNG